MEMEHDTVATKGPTPERAAALQRLLAERKLRKVAEIPPNGSGPATQLPPTAPVASPKPSTVVIPPKLSIKTPAPTYVPISTDAESIQMKAVRWHWKGRLAQGKLTTFDGDPGVGKDIITIDIVARFTRGDMMPDGSPGPGPLNVLWISDEDDQEDTIKPRLVAAGADMSRVRIMSGIPTPNGEERDITLPGDLKIIQAEAQHFSARVVVFSPFFSFVNVEAKSERVMRVLLRKIQRVLAGATGALVILVRHLNKTQVANAIYRGMGSIATTAFCRTAFLFANDPDQQGVRVMACTKNNLSEEPASLRYTPVGCTVNAAYLSKPIETVKVKWLGESSRSANGLLAFATSGKEPKSQAEVATSFLELELELGPKLKSEVIKRAAGQGFSERTIERAAEDLRVVVSQVDGSPLKPGKPAYWGLP